MKYMVMECHLSYAVVLDEEGRFLKAANQHYKVGQVVSDIVEMQVPPPAAGKKAYSHIYSLAALAACLILVMTLVFQTGQPAYASVYMTINPEVRIDVNRNDIAVGLKGINADGEELIRGYSYKKKELDLVMDELVERAIDMGYLHEGGKISLTLDTQDNEWVISHREALTDNLNDYLTEKMTVTIEVSDKNDRQNQVIIPVGPGGNGDGDEDPADDGRTDYDDHGEDITTDFNEADSDYGQMHNSAPDKDDSRSDYDDDSDDYEDYDSDDYNDDVDNDNVHEEIDNDDEDNDDDDGNDDDDD